MISWAGNMVKKDPVILKFQNVGKDFSADFQFINVTKSGNLRVKEIIGSSPQGIQLGKTKIAKLTKIGDKKKYKIFEGGSPFNTYYLEF